MKVLSIRQPWAWLIVNGYKDIENRTWRTNIRGPVLIHAGKEPDHERIPLFEALSFRGMDCTDMERGGIVGVATITDCVTESASPWFAGPFASR
jgi:hypothetical protein